MRVHQWFVIGFYALFLCKSRKSNEFAPSEAISDAGAVKERLEREKCFYYVSLSPVSRATCTIQHLNERIRPIPNFSAHKQDCHWATPAILQTKLTGLNLSAGVQTFDVDPEKQRPRLAA